MNYDLVIFDWDGTVMDSTGRIVQCMQRAAEDLALPPLEDHQARNIIGLGLPEAIRTLFPGIGDESLEQMRARYAHHFVQAEATPSPLFPGAEAVLQGFLDAGVKQAVATGKSRKGLSRVWGNTGLAHYFHGSRCADESRSKPHPAMVLELLEEFGVAPERALMVGDTTFDLEMAQAAGIDRVGVSYGAHPAARLESYAPRAIIDHLEQLPPLVGVTDSEPMMETV